MLDIVSFYKAKTELAIGLHFPAYLIPHPNKVLWVIHQHRLAYDLWDGYCGLKHYPLGEAIREVIIKCDKAVAAEAKHIYANSKTVAKRLKDFCEIASNVLYHPPPFAEQFYTNSDDNYLFFPSRIAKRHALVIKALAKTRERVIVKIAGAAFYPNMLENLQKLAKSEGEVDRVMWLGHVNEEEKLTYYANATGVIFPPYDEDYGYITLEAMLASKAVITCSASGGPLEFVTQRETGLIADPTSEGLALARAELWQHRDKALEWGKNGRMYYDSLNLSWDKVVRNLLA